MLGLGPVGGQAVSDLLWVNPGSATAAFTGGAYYYAAGGQGVDKNVAGQGVTLFAFDYATGAPKTSDAANLLFYLSKDDGAVTLITANSGVPTETSATNAKGDYSIALTQAETNATKLRFSGKSSTSNVAVVPATVYTTPPNFDDLLISSAGGIGAATVTSNTDKTGYSLTVTPPTAAQVATQVWQDLTASGDMTVTGSVGKLLVTDLDATVSSRGTSTVTLAGIENAVWDAAAGSHTVTTTMGGKVGTYLDAAVTSRLAPTSAGRTVDVTSTGEVGIDWGNIGNASATVALSNTAVGSVVNSGDNAILATLGALEAELLARTLVAANYATAANQAAIAGYIDTEIGTIITHLTDIKGAGFSGSTDSLEALRDRGDAAWVTATGFSTLDAAGVRTAVGLASANLDAQLAAIKTDTAAILDDTGTSGVVVAGLGTQAKADVNAEVVDALASDTYAAPSAAPLPSASLAAKINWAHALNLHPIEQTSSRQSVLGYSGSSTIGTASITLSGDSATLTRGKFL